VALLDVTEVSVNFGGNMALTDVTLAVEAHSITGLIGPNGAGKTTLFNVITGLQAPSRGKVSMNGINITGFAPHDRAQRGMARTFQRIELFGSLTARENLQVGAEIKRSFGNAEMSAQERVESVVALIGMDPFADVRADRLTTGQARLVELGRALVTRPKLLLLDEPASGLDADETEYFARILRGLASAGMAILLVEHDIPLVMSVCQVIYVLDFGRVLAVGPPEEIRENQLVIDAYLGASAEVEG